MNGRSTEREGATIDMDLDPKDPLNALENLGMVYAYTYKIAGEDGILELFGDKITGCEHLQHWATELRQMKLVNLADLLDSIARTMPPDDTIPDKNKGWSFDKPCEERWIQYLADHPDDERLIKHDQEW